MKKIEQLNTFSKKKRRKKLTHGRQGKYRFNSFFAGIGGFDLGFERAGISPAFHCEISDYCNSVLRRHWPRIPHTKDINEIDINKLPSAEVWCGGFPCQDVSVARGWLGREGLNGKNSGLFYPFFDLVRQKQPEVVLLENVTGLLSSHKGHDFKTIISSLTNIGYGVAWRVVNARYFGAPQSRPRIFICAWKNRLDLALYSLFEQQGGSSVKNARKGFITPTVCKETGASVPLVGYCLAATSGRHTGTDWSRTYVSYYDQVRRLTPTECEGLQGFPTGWSLPEKGYPLCDDEIDTLRYHAIGNAVSVPVIEWIATRIECLLSGKTSAFRISEQPFFSLDMVQDTFQDFVNQAALQQISLQQDEIDKESKIHWSNGGAAYRHFSITGNVSPAPNVPIEKKLIEVIEKTRVDKKYYLSSNASTGILRRVNKQGRTLFDPLYKALQRLSQKTADNNLVDFCNESTKG